MKLPIKRKIRTLENGLKVILIQKKGFSKSFFMMGVPAGSLNQIDLVNGQTIDHRSGCAHFLEHQMFRLNGEDVTYPLARAQARCNAMTTYSMTSYFVSTQADPFEPLRLLIEFVQTLEITPETVEKEKGIILSEYYQYEQDPDSRLQLETFRSLYQTLPLKEDVLGTVEDIQEMSVQDLEAFYQTWYDPSQLVLIGITGHELEPLFSFIEEMEKNHPSCKEYKAKRYLAFEPREVARKHFETKMDVQLGYAGLGVKLPPMGENCSGKEIVKKDYMLNLWINAFFGPLSQDWQTWLDTRLMASGNIAEGDLDTDHGYIMIYALTDRPQEYLETMKEILKKKPLLTQEKFESLLIQEKAGSIRTFDNFDSLAFVSLEGAFGDFDFFEDLSLLNSITLEEVNDYISSLDFSNLCETIITPLHPYDEEDFEAEQDCRSF